MQIIEVTDLTKVYDSGLKRGGVVALDLVSLHIEQGEIFGLLGPNGAGKTTLFKVLLSIVRATEGDALINGLPPSDPNSRAKVGYLPENHRFPNHLTGLGLLESTGRLYGLSQADLDSRTDSLLSLVGMQKWANTKIKKYSKGMGQRIGLAQALIADPDILMLDEPTDGIDPVGKVEIREILMTLKGQGKTVVINSHLLSEVEQAADRVAIMSRGKIARVGTVGDLTSRDSQYEIEAEIGDQIIELPEEMGKIRNVTSSRLVVELVNPGDVNYLIDQLRAKRINIQSIKPVKITLEQSFFETVRGRQEQAV